MKKEPIILIGGGGHCKSVIDVIELQDKYEIVGIIDIPEKLNQEVLGYKIIGQDSNLPELVKKYNNFHITLGQLRNSEPRIKLFNQLKQLNANLPIIISPLAYISKHTVIEEGTVIMHNVIINANAKIGMNCIINTKALIEHDAVIGNHCHISTGAIVNGGVQIGNNVFYGSGAVSKEYVSIPDNSFIKANSIVK